MGYTVYWYQASYNKFNFGFVEDVKKACDEYTKQTGDVLEFSSDNTHFISINSKNNGCESCVINAPGTKSAFCKTARQPYTLLVKAILLIAKKYDHVYNLHCDDSDDTDHESWKEAKDFVKNLNLLVFN